MVQLSPILLNTGLLTCTDTLCAVDENHRDDRHVEVRFNELAVVTGLERHERVIAGVEHRARNGGDLGVDVTGRGVVLTALVASTELSIRHEKVHVVATDVVLRKVDDGRHQTLLAVMVLGVLGYVADKLRDLLTAVGQCETREEKRCG